VTGQERGYVKFLEIVWPIIPEDPSVWLRMLDILCQQVSALAGELAGENDTPACTSLRQLTKEQLRRTLP
jgi:hypothetical protein